LGAEWRRGLGILCVTHDINLLSLLPDPEKIRLLGVRAGELMFDVSYTDQKLGEKLTQLYGVAFEALERPSAAGPQRWFLPKSEPRAEPPT